MEEKKKRHYPKRYTDDKGVLRDYMGYKVKPKVKPLDWVMAAKICEQVALGYSLTHVIEENKHKKGWPKGITTWYSWCRKHPELQDLYNQAQEDRTDTYVDHILRVVRAVEQGNTAVDIGKFVADQLKWVAAKHNKRRYGEQKTAVSADEGDGPLKVEFNVILPKDQGEVKPVEAEVIDVPLLEESKK
jgi:hypothetical protein